MAIPAPGSTAEALDMVLTGLSFMAAADPAALTFRAQAECLLAFEQADAMSTAARAGFLTAFTAGQGYAEDADYSPTAWLIHRTLITKGAARGHLGWARRVQAHPQVVAALAEGTVLTESMARTSCNRSADGAKDEAVEGETDGEAVEGETDGATVEGETDGETTGPEETTSTTPYPASRREPAGGVDWITLPWGEGDSWNE